MLEEFRQIAERFAAFVASKGLGKLQPNQWEISYLNHIFQATVWNSASDWGFFRPLAATKDNPTTVKFETFRGEWHFVIPPDRGRLHVEWRHGKTHESAKELVALNLTARGPVRPSGQNGEIGLPVVYDGLTVGHDAIVSSFRDFMSDDANKYWGLKQ